MTARHDHVGDVVGDGDADEMLGDVQRHVAPAVHDAEVLLAGCDEVDGVPGLALGQGEREVGVLVEERAHHRRHEPAHRGGEGGHPQPTGHATGVAVQSGLELLQVGQQARSVGDEPTAVIGQHHAAAHPLEQRDTGLLLQPLDLLGDRAGREAEGIGGADDGTVRVDGSEAGQGSQINHVAMLHRSIHQRLLVLHRHSTQTGSGELP